MFSGKQNNLVQNFFGIYRPEKEEEGLSSLTVVRPTFVISSMTATSGRASEEVDVVFWWA